MHDLFCVRVLYVSVCACACLCACVCSSFRTSEIFFPDNRFSFNHTRLNKAASVFARVALQEQSLRQLRGCRGILLTLRTGRLAGLYLFKVVTCKTLQTNIFSPLTNYSNLSSSPSMHSAVFFPFIFSFTSNLWKNKDCSQKWLPLANDWQSPTLLPPIFLDYFYHLIFLIFFLLLLKVLRARVLLCFFNSFLERTTRNCNFFLRSDNNYSPLQILPSLFIFSSSSFFSYYPLRPPRPAGRSSTASGCLAAAAW